MRDLVGFIILVAGIIAILLFIIGLVFVLTVYLFSITLFFIASAGIIALGRAHPKHLDWYLKPNLIPLIVLLSVALPLLHGAYLYIGGHSGLWYIIMGVNGIPSVVWASRLALLHRKQKIRYVREGHDIEELLDKVQSRESALEIRIDVLQSGFAEVRALEPWEVQEGLGPDLIATEEAQQCIINLQSLREDFLSIMKLLDTAHTEIKEGKIQPPHPLLEEAKQMLVELEKRYKEDMHKAETILADALGGVWAGFNI